MILLFAIHFYSAAGNLKTIKLGPDGKLFTYDYVVDYTERASDFYEDSVSCLVNGYITILFVTLIYHCRTRIIRYNLGKPKILFKPVVLNV